MLELYKNIKKRREELGMSQAELARKVGYADRSAIARIERGDYDLPQTKILEIAKALKIPPGELMGLDGVTPDAYYFDPEVAEMAEEIANNEGLRVLFDATRDISKEDLQFVIQMVERISKKSGD